MILYPLYLINIKEVDVLVLSDHRNINCGAIYKIAQDHSSQEVMRVARLAQSEEEKYINAHCDLRTFASFVQNDPSTPQKDRVNKQAAFTVASLLVHGINDSSLMCGTEIDPETLKVRYWLVIQGFTGEIRVRLKKYRGSKV